MSCLVPPWASPFHFRAKSGPGFPSQKFAQKRFTLGNFRKKLQVVNASLCERGDGILLRVKNELRSKFLEILLKVFNISYVDLSLKSYYHMDLQQNCVQIIQFSLFQTFIKVVSGKSISSGVFMEVQATLLIGIHQLHRTKPCSTRFAQSVFSSL